MSVIQRYRNTIFGDIEFAGNSLLISELSRGGSSYVNSSSPLTGSVSPKAQVKALPDLSTYCLTDYGSSGKLYLSETAKVLYAELIWGGKYFINNSLADTDYLNNSIKLTLPDNTSHIIKPLAKTAFTQKLNGYDNVYAYTRSAVITNLVSSAGAGSYTVSGVSDANTKEDLLHRLSMGWLIAVVYEDKANCSLRSIRFYEGGSQIEAGGQTNVLSFPGLYVGKESSVLFAVFGSDPAFNKSTVELKPSPTAEALPLYGYNNKIDNLFASRINSISKNLDTGGSFSNYNFDNNDFNPAGAFYSHSGFDVRRIELVSTLDKRTESPQLLFKARQGSFVLGAAAISSPELLPEISAQEEHRAIAGMPGYCEYIIKISSTGNCDADNISITVDFDDGFSVLDKSLTVDGLPKSGASIVYPSSVKLAAGQKCGAPIEISFIVGGFTPDLMISPGKFKIKYILGNITSPETVYKLSVWKAGGATVPQHEQGFSICQLLWDKLYAYNIEEVRNFEIQYRTARRFMAQQSAVLSCNYTIKLYYTDSLKKEQLSVKSGSATFFDFPDDFGDNYTVKIIPMPIKINGNEVIFKAVVRITKQDL